MDRDDALFVVFTRKGGADETYTSRPETESLALDGTWTLAFTAERYYKA